MLEEECAPLKPAAQGEVLKELTMQNKRGLHARASAKFVSCVERFDCEVEVTRCNETVGGLSIMGLMMLNAVIGSNIALRAKGSQAQQVIDALSELINDRFGEGE